MKLTKTDFRYPKTLSAIVALALSLAVLLVFPVSAAPVNPESNHVDRFIVAAVNITNETRDVAVQDDVDWLHRIADAFIEYYPDHAFHETIANPGGELIDPEDPESGLTETSYTNQEKAEFVLLKLQEYGAAVLRRHAEDAAEQSHKATVESAGETAAADFAAP